MQAIMCAMEACNDNPTKSAYDILNDRQLAIASELATKALNATAAERGEEFGAFMGNVITPAHLIEISHKAVTAIRMAEASDLKPFIKPLTSA
jgi:hypothetical protein